MRGGDSMNSELLRARLTEKNITVSEVAEHLGYTRQTIYNKLKGTSKLTFADVQALSKLLEMNEGDFMKTFL